MSVYLLSTIFDALKSLLFFHCTGILLSLGNEVVIEGVFEEFIAGLIGIFEVFFLEFVAVVLEEQTISLFLAAQHF
jgi:hypothetical protein